MSLQTEEETGTRMEEGLALSEWAQSVLASDGDLLAEVPRLGPDGIVLAVSSDERTTWRMIRR